LKRIVKVALGAAALAWATPILAQPAPCQLGAYRDRIDHTLKSMVVEARTEAALVNGKGVAFRAVDYGLSGEIEGCVALSGPIPDAYPGYSWFYDVPAIGMAQEHMLMNDPRLPYKLPVVIGDGNISTPVLATGRFKSSDGAGMNLFLPARAADWNGKLFVVQRGSGVYNPLQPAARRAAGDPFPTASGANQFVENMIDRGYAVAYFRKDAARPPLGVSKARLSDGREITTSFVASIALALAMTEFAQKEVEAALGRPAQKTYYYGHSGGGITARLLNMSGSNARADGRRIIDGFIIDDAGNGLYLPVGFRNGSDVVLATDADRKRFAPELEIGRQLYNTASFLLAKRLNNRMLLDKGLGLKHRFYEIRDVSHVDVGGTGPMVKDLDPSNVLELSGLITAMIDNLDTWIDSGVEPPASRGPDDPAGGVLMPEAACPLGTYWSDAPSATTRLDVFDGKTAGRGGPPQTVTQAWRRMGLIGSDEIVDRLHYLACIDRATSALIAERFLPSGSRAWYQRYAAGLLERTGARLG
jgi:hypothetical protein